jgi:hypothetical protein
LPNDSALIFPRARLLLALFLVINYATIFDFLDVIKAGFFGFLKTSNKFSIDFGKVKKEGGGLKTPIWLQTPKKGQKPLFWPF